MWRRGAAWAWGRRGAGTAVPGPSAGGPRAAADRKCGAEPRDGLGRAAALGLGFGSLRAVGMRWSGSGGAGAGSDLGAAPGEPERGRTVRRLWGSRSGVRLEL